MALKSVITGGAGFIGSNLTDHLVRIGHKVIVLDNFVSGKKSNLSHHKKKDVKIIPITASTFRPERSERKSIVPAAIPPEIKAPKAKGIPIAYAIATPGTTEWDSASPINDQPFSIKKEDRNAQTIPTNVETHIAFII